MKTGRLSRQEYPLDKILSELDAARYDLQDAQDSFGQMKTKWALIQGYSSIRHSARVLLHVRGYKEQDDDALRTALEQLYPDELARGLITAFARTIQSKLDAEENLTVTEDGAVESIETAKAYLSVARNILKAK